MLLTEGYFNTKATISLRSAVGNPKVLIDLQEKLKGNGVKLTNPNNLHMTWFNWGSYETLRDAVFQASSVTDAVEFEEILKSHLVDVKRHVDKIGSAKMTVYGEEVQLYGNLLNLKGKPFWGLTLSIPPTQTDYSKEVSALAEDFLDKSRVHDPLDFIKTYKPMSSYTDGSLDPHVSLAKPPVIINPSIQPRDSIPVVLLKPELETGGFISFINAVVPAKRVA